MNDFLEYILYFILTISILSSIVGSVLFTSLNKVNRFFILYIILGTTIDCLASLFAHYKGNNLIFLHINVLLEFIVLTYFFANIFFANKNLLVKWVLVTGILIIIFNSLFIQNIFTFNSISLTLNSIYLIGCCLYFFYQIIDKEKSTNEDIFTKYAVWSIFILQSISFMVLFLGNYLLEIESDVENIIWTLRAIIIGLVKCLILYQLCRMVLDKYNIKKINE